MRASIPQKLHLTRPPVKHKISPGQRGKNGSHSARPSGRIRTIHRPDNDLPANPLHAHDRGASRERMVDEADGPVIPMDPASPYDPRDPLLRIQRAPETGGDTLARTHPSTGTLAQSIAPLPRSIRGLESDRTRETMRGMRGRDRRHRQVRNNARRRTSRRPILHKIHSQERGYDPAHLVAQADAGKPYQTDRMPVQPQPEQTSSPSRSAKPIQPEPPHPEQIESDSQQVKHRPHPGHAGADDPHPQSIDAPRGGRRRIETGNPQRRSSSIESIPAASLDHPRDTPGGSSPGGSTGAGGRQAALPAPEMHPIKRHTGDIRRKDGGEHLDPIPPRKNATAGQYGGQKSGQNQRNDRKTQISQNRTNPGPGNQPPKPGKDPHTRSSRGRPGHTPDTRKASRPTHGSSNHTGSQQKTDRSTAAGSSPNSRNTPNTDDERDRSKRDTTSGSLQKFKRRLDE